MDEFVDGILGYKHGNVQIMRKIARHFFVFNPRKGTQTDDRAAESEQNLFFPGRLCGGPAGHQPQH